MFKFRRETWGKKIDHEREWSTCYSDVMRGYGKFLGKNLIHLRKAPKLHQAKSRQYPKLSGPLAPRVDHMWDVLQGKGIAGYGNSRQRLSWLLSEQQKKRTLQYRKARAADPEHIRSTKQTAWKDNLILPRLDSVQDAGRRTKLLTPREVLVNIPQQRLPRWSKNIDVGCSYQRRTPLDNMADARDRIRNARTPLCSSDDVPRAGLPTVWKKKPAHHIQIPPPYQVQPPPIPFSHTRESNLHTYPGGDTHRSGAQVSTQTTPPSPPAPPAAPQTPRTPPLGAAALTPLPEIKNRRYAPRMSNGLSGLAPPRVRFPLPEVEPARTRPDISYIVDRYPATPDLHTRLTSNRASKSTISAR